MFRVTEARFRMMSVLLSLLLAINPLHSAASIEGNQLPDFGDSSGVAISPAQEQAFGEAFMRSIRSQTTLVSDPLIDHYLKALGNRLAANSDAPEYPFTFFVVDDGSVNAFAGPGGYIGIHTGLISTAQNESELAGVVSHEIAHVTQRHLLRAYESASQMSLPTAAAILAGILLGVASGNVDAGIAAVTAVQAGNIQHQLNFTRTNEKEADRIGIQTLARSNIDPFGMPSFFERLHQSTRLYGGSQMPEFLSTHPVTSDRIAESVSRAKAYDKGKAKDSLPFQLTRARMKVILARDARTSLLTFKTLSKENPTVANRYGLALAQQLNGQLPAARKILAGLLESDPDNLFYRITMANLYLDEKTPQKALDLFKDTLALYPNNAVISQYYAAAMIRSGKADEARRLIIKLLRDPAARTSGIYELWAKASALSGPAWETRQATAEIYFMNGGVQSAIDQLQQALQTQGLSQYEEARIQARLKEFKIVLDAREQ